MDPITGFLAFAVTVFSSFPLVSKLFKGEDIFTRLIISFVFGLSSILLPLYLVGVFLGYGFVAVSWIIFLISVTLFMVNAIKFASQLPEYVCKHKNVLNVAISPIDYAFIAAILFFIFKYLFFLTIKGIFDWDAIDLYLPFGRRIYETDSVPLYGHDYEPIIYPIGISFLYAWINSLSGSAYNENFRFLPLLFILVIILTIYVLVADFGSKGIARIAVIIYALLPLHDSALFYASYYPDLCYNALVLAMFLFLYKYVGNRGIRYCLMGGTSLGFAILMKLQAAYFLPATLFVFAGLIEHRSLRLLATYLSSLFTGLLFIFFVYPDLGFFWGLSVTLQALFFVVIFGITTLVAFATEGFAAVLQIKRRDVLQVIKSALVFYGVAALIASIWFLRNQLLVGSWLWSSRISHSDHVWAINFLSSVQNPTTYGNIGTFLLSFVLIPFFVHDLGTLWVIPKLLGMIRITKCQKKSSIIILWICGYLIGYFLSTFHHFELYSQNPRDMWSLAPFFSLFAAFGISCVAKYFTKKHDEALIIYLLSSLGLASLTQSLLIYSYGPDPLRNGLLAWRFPNNYSGTLVSFIPSLLLLVFVINALIFSLPILWKFIQGLLMRCRRVRVKLEVNFSLENWSKRIVPIILMLMLLVAPYIWLTYEVSSGDIQVFGENQLKPLYGGLYTEVASYLNDHVKDGDVILMTHDYFLQYYLRRDVKVVALDVPANLAAFRSVIESNNLSNILYSLRELGIRYFLLTKGASPLLEKLSRESMLPSVMNDPRYFMLIKSFSSWILYEFIAFKYMMVKGWEDSSFMENWTYIREEPNGGMNYLFKSDGNILTINVAGNTRADFQYLGIPFINTTEYPFVACRVKGSPNARWLFRLYSPDYKIGYDFPYWKEPTEDWKIYFFNIAETPLNGQLLNKEARLAVQSIDSNPATLYIDFYYIFRYEFSNG